MTVSDRDSCLDRCSRLFTLILHEQSSIVDNNNALRDKDADESNEEGKTAAKQDDAKAKQKSRAKAC